jgi:hypothetical protein
MCINHQFIFFCHIKNCRYINFCNRELLRLLCVGTLIYVKSLSESSSIIIAFELKFSYLHVYLYLFLRSHNNATYLICTYRRWAEYFTVKKCVLCIKSFGHFQNQSFSETLYVSFFYTYIVSPLFFIFYETILDSSCMFYWYHI